MLIRFAFALSLLLAAPAAAQTAPPAPAPAEDLVKVALDTSAGRIVLALDRGHAPITTKNFLRYVDSGRLNGESFYRAMKFGESGGLVQAGITSDARKLYPAIEHEPVSKTGIKHVAGTVSMAAFSPGTAKADFFILVSRQPVVRRQLRRLRPCGRGDGRGEDDTRLTDFADQGRGRDEGPDARSGRQDHESRTGRVMPPLCGSSSGQVRRRGKRGFRNRAGNFSISSSV